ncbi:hypothetical protein EV361DRAFT_1032396 [Lentinula raphanica]|nr:hypothetical protein EV361DRAFT_1032396 [Lentinula raphanica]
MYSTMECNNSSGKDMRDTCRWYRSEKHWSRLNARTRCIIIIQPNCSVHTTMSRASRSVSGPPTTTTTTVTAADFELWTRAPQITPSDDHTNSTSTRSPSLYDSHIPDVLQPKTILLGKSQYQLASAQDHYFSKLLEQPDVLNKVSGGVRDYLRLQWRRDLQYIRRLRVWNENSVMDAEKRIAEIVYDLASLVILDLSTDDIKNTGSWIPFVTHSSQETEAGMLLGLAKDKIIMETDPRNHLERPPSLPRQLNMDFMQYILAEECIHSRLGDPMGYLALLLLSLLTQSEPPISLWSNPECEHCGEFAESHKARDGFAAVRIPKDCAGGYGLTMSNADDLYAEIHRALRLVVESRGSSMQVREPMLKILQSSLVNQQNMLKQFGGLDNLLNIIMVWVNSMHNVFVQACAQLIRHNLTFAVVSSYNHSWLFQRNRKTAHIVMSPFQQASGEGHIIQRALFFLDAYHDSLDRSQNDVLLDDPYRGVQSEPDQLPDPIVSSSQASEEPEYIWEYEPKKIDSEDPENPVSFATDANGNKLRRSKRKKTQLKRANPGPLSGKPPHPPPHGGGTGGAGTRQGRSRTGTRTTSASMTQRSSSGASSGSSVERARRKV